MSATKYLFTKGLDDYFIGVYNVLQFTLRFFKEVFVPPYHFGSIVNQCYEVGLKSLPLITLTGFIVGVVFTKQSRPSLENFGGLYPLPFVQED